jgi:predicted Na+-dependent transporter
MHHLNEFVNRFFGLILLLAAISGLFVPPFRIETSTLIIASLAFIIFTSFFKVELNRNLFTDDLLPASRYFVIRFVLLPVAVFFATTWLSPFYAVAFLLILLLPSAVSSPAFTAMFSGNIHLSLKILVFSSFLSILTIPVCCGMLLSKEVDINSRNLFMTMVYTIVLPFLVHLPFRKSAGISHFLVSNSPLITALGLSVVFIAATSRNRSVIFNNPEKILWYALISLLTYLVLYLTGYYLMARQDNARRISYSVSSGANNIGLGVTITALFFPGDVNVFFIIAQLAWIFLLIPMRYFYRKNSKA